MLSALSNNSYIVYWEGLLMTSGGYIILPFHGLVPYMSVHFQDAESFIIKTQFNCHTVLSDCNTMIAFETFVNTVSVLTTEKRRMLFPLTCFSL